MRFTSKLYGDVLAWFSLCLDDSSSCFFINCTNYIGVFSVAIPHSKWDCVSRFSFAICSQQEQVRLVFCGGTAAKNPLTIVFCSLIVVWTQTKTGLISHGLSPILFHILPCASAVPFAEADIFCTYKIFNIEHCVVFFADLSWDFVQKNLFSNLRFIV